MTNKKPTKKDNYTALLIIIDIMKQNDVDVDLGMEDITYDSLCDFVNNELRLLENKTAAAKKRAEEKKAEGDALREKIYEVMGEDWITGEEILSRIDDPDVTKSMISPRINALVDLNRAEKEVRTIPAETEGGKSHKRCVYRRLY